MFREVLCSVIAFVLCASVCRDCLGRIGETEAEVRKRYGEPLWERTEGEVVPVGADKFIYFEKNSIRVSVVLRRGKSVCEIYDFRDANGEQEPITDETNMNKVEGILEANSQGHKWKRHVAAHMVLKGSRHVWERTDDGAAAIVWSNEPSVIEVTDTKWRLEANREEKTANAGVEGF